MCGGGESGLDPRGVHRPLSPWPLPVCLWIPYRHQVPIPGVRCISGPCQSVTVTRARATGESGGMSTLTCPKGTTRLPCAPKRRTGSGRAWHSARSESGHRRRRARGRHDARDLSRAASQLRALNAAASESPSRRRRVRSRLRFLHWGTGAGSLRKSPGRRSSARSTQHWHLAEVAA